MTPKVTAICPTHNRRRYIPSVIACFLSQTYTDSELVIVDDGTDSVADLIPDNPRIRYIRLEGPRRTTGEKRNICCGHAQGEFIVHFDDDDWSAPERIADQIAKLESSGKQVMTYHNILYWNVLTRKIYRFQPVSEGTPYGATFCYRKTWWEQHRFDNIVLGEDTNFAHAAERVRQFLYADAGQSVVVRAHDGNTSPTAVHMGSSGVPERGRGEIPIAFLSSMPKVLVAIVTCKKYAERAKALRDTWVPLVQASGYDVEFFDGERLNVPDDYLNLPLKAKAIFKWAAEHGYDRLLKVDDDTFIQADRLAPVDADYAGNLCDANDWGRPGDGIPNFPKGTFPHTYITGGAVWFSKKAIQILVDTPLNGDFADDRWVGQTLAQAGIRPTMLPDFYWHPFRRPSGTDFTVITALPSPEAVRNLHGSKIPKSNSRVQPFNLQNNLKSPRVQQGSLLIAVAAVRGQPATVSDTLNNTWEPVPSTPVSGHGWNLHMWWCIAKSDGINTVTISGSPHIGIIEYPMDGVTPVLANSGINIGAKAGAITVTSGDAGSVDLTVSAAVNTMQIYGGTYIPVGYKNRVQEPPTKGATLICADTTTGKQSATWQGWEGGSWLAVIACFRLVVK